MKLLRHYRIFSRPLVFLVAFLFMNFTTDKFNVVAPAKDQTIMIALLLDTSNSMDGLIDQAKSQLWKIVNEVAVAKSQDGKRPNIKIALYEYGNDGLSSNEGFIRQVSALSEDLDVISEKLFSLRTNGGNEFCGQVIKTSLDQLAWSASKDDLKMIFIAGNEDFTQGSVSYQQACDAAKKKGVIVNTIYCGYVNDGINLGWNRGAELTSGAFMSIDQNNKTAYVPTPYDDQMAALNDKLNATYVYYGESGEERKEQQIVQDKNAASYGLSNIAERSFCKSSHAYKNSSWDLVDAAKDNAKLIVEMKSGDLPTEMRTMSIEQRKAYIKQKSEERTTIQAEIQSLNKKRQEYIYKTPRGGKDKMLDASMMKAIKEQGRAKNLKWDQVEEVEEVEEGEKGNKSGVANILFQSTDGGQTWQDISEGLPAIEQPINFFAGESDLYLKVKNVMYRSKNNLKTPVWEKENVPDPQNASIAFNPMNVVKSEGVIIATGQKGIRRSTDNGEHWQWVISEGGVGIAVERIKGGFAAITYSTASNTRRVRTSYDGGKTWQAIDAGLPADLSIASIIQVGENFFCGHPKGIYRSTDKGKTWKLLLPSIEGKVFNLSVSGNVIYAIPRSGGC